MQSNYSVANYLFTNRSILNSHDFLILSLKQFVYFLDVLIMKFLQFEFGILLIVLRESVFYGFL